MMTPTTTPSLEALVSDMRNLTAQVRRAQLRTLLPVVDELSRQGVPHESLAATMTAAGIPVNAAALRKALSRWRHHTRNLAAKAPAGQVAATPSLQTALPTTQQSPRATGAITSKADLVQLRKSQAPIDLNQLAEMGRRK
ncbi:MAG: hypothetical protein ACN6O8_09855 [Achromobacter sp.]|uniref:hypothetical protein n=1 Tax=Achromobacter sp. TaxID=134375 RepID=UPI003D00DD68